jgi:hypothetical protein
MSGKLFSPAERITQARKTRAGGMSESSAFNSLLPLCAISTGDTSATKVSKAIKEIRERSSSHPALTFPLFSTREIEATFIMAAIKFLPDYPG